MSEWRGIQVHRGTIESGRSHPATAQRSRIQTRTGDEPNKAALHLTLLASEQQSAVSLLILLPLKITRKYDVLAKILICRDSGHFDHFAMPSFTEMPEDFL